MVRISLHQTLCWSRIEIFPQIKPPSTTFAHIKVLSFFSGPYFFAEIVIPGIEDYLNYRATNALAKNRPPTTENLIPDPIVPDPDPNFIGFTKHNTDFVNFDSVDNWQ